MHSVTSNAVAEALSYSDTEKECGYYFGGKRYRKTFYFPSINIVANAPMVLQSNFEIPMNKVVGMSGFAINDSYWFNGLELYMAFQDNQLCMYPKLGGGVYTIVIDVMYIK